MSSSSPNTIYRPLATEDRHALLDVAQLSIRIGLKTGNPGQFVVKKFAEALRQPRASFVTLFIGQALRGCIGSVNARFPLVTDVAENAFHAAMDDPRFARLSEREFHQLAIHVSVLSAMEPFAFSGENELLQQIRVGTDGLALEWGQHRGLLLPSVWERIGDRRRFLDVLKKKAGLNPSFWSDGIKVHRFVTESFSRAPSKP